MLAGRTQRLAQGERRGGGENVEGAAPEEFFPRRGKQGIAPGAYIQVDAVFVQFEEQVRNGFERCCQLGLAAAQALIDPPGVYRH